MVNSDKERIAIRKMNGYKLLPKGALVAVISFWISGFFAGIFIHSILVAP